METPEIEKRFEKMEKRIEKTEDKINEILQEIAGFKPILNSINENIQKISENAIDKDRVVKLENKVDELEKELSMETIQKKAKMLEEIIKYIVLAIIGVALGYFIK